MDDRIRYVYKVFDKLNEDNFYIGTTFDIERRWKEHKNKSNSHKLTTDMLEFGAQDFNIEILFSGNEYEAYNKEIELINKLKPYYNNKNDNGGNLFIDNKGENNSQAKLTEQDIIDICNRIVVNGERVTDVAKDYPQVTGSLIGQIVRGDAWDHVIEAPRRGAGKINIKGENSFHAKLSEQDIIDICNRVVVDGECVIDVAKDYPQVSEHYIYKIINGNAWEDVKEAPRKKAYKNFTKDEVSEIRTLAFEGKTAEDIQEYICPYKEVRAVERVITGKSFRNYEGPIMGEDY